MSKLDDAFAAFHLEEGSTFAAAKRKYRQFVKASHPDLMRGDEGKQMAEAYLKTINNLFEYLENHFREAHKENEQCHHSRKTKSSDENFSESVDLSNRFRRSPASFRTERNTPRAGEPSAAELMAAAEKRMKKREDKELKQRIEAEKEEREWRDRQASNRIIQEAARQIFLNRLKRRTSNPEEA